MNKLTSLITRYISIAILGLALPLLTLILTPLTTQSTAFILNIFSPAITIDNTIIFQNIIIELIPACIAVSAYFLLLILIFSTPNIKAKTRAYITLGSLAALFILNILRITILALINNSIYFESLHLLFWYGLSTIFVVAIWIIVVKLFKVEDIPIYSDLKYLASLTRKRKKH